MKSKVIFSENMHFIANIDNFHIDLDLDKDEGGSNKGPRPKGLILTALAGCTGMDVISILRKMRTEPEFFNVEVEAELTEDHPKIFKSIKISYNFGGKNINRANIEKAVNLSQTNC